MIKNAKLSILMLLLSINVFSQSVDDKTVNSYLEALSKSDITQIKNLIDNGFPVNFRFTNYNQATSLHLLVNDNIVNKDIINLLIQEGANIYALDSNNNTPFMISLFNSDFAMTDVFLNEYDYDINTKVGPMIGTNFDNNASPLTYSIMRGDEQIINYLIKNGIDIEPAVDFLLSAVYANQYLIVDGYINTSFGINHTSTIYNNSSALFIANENNNKRMVTYLLENGANINQRNAGDMTVFDVAVRMHYFELANLYLNKYNYDVTQLDAWHRNSLFYVTINEDVEAIKYLLGNGISPNSYQYDSSHYLNVYFGQQVQNNTEINKEVVSLYIEYGLKLDEQDMYGYTYYHNVALTNDPELLDGIKINTPDLNIQTFDDLNTALLFSIFGENYEVTKKLIALGADPNIKNSEGNTALHYLALKGNIELIRYLLDNRANCTIMNNDGKTFVQLCSDEILVNVNEILLTITQ